MVVYPLQHCLVLFEPEHDKTNIMTDARKEDTESAQTDQSLRCSYEEALGP